MSDPPLRLVCRDDGDGPRAHARLIVPATAGAQSSSQQAPSAPRIGDKQRYA